MVDLKEKKITIFGTGVSGLSALKLCNQLGALVSVVSSGNPVAWKNYEEVLKFLPAENCYSENESSLEIFSHSDMIILSPGISRSHPLLKDVIERDIPIISEIELAFQALGKLSAPIIAITGSNGKTTTTTMVGEMIKASSESVFVGGNIGIPFCDYVLSGKKVDYIVLELSSFQLESILFFKADIALILNVYPNHGERYESIASYFEAKSFITNNMSSKDLLIYPNDQEIITTWGDAQHMKKATFSLKSQTEIKAKIESEYSLKEFKPLGGHSLINLYSMITIGKEINIKKEAIQRVINTFCGIEHRLEYVKTSLSYNVFNDAKSTNWDALMVALRSFNGRGKKLDVIIGGKRRGRGDEISPYIKELKQYVDHVFLIGETTDDLAKEIEGKIPHKKSYTLDNVVDYLNRVHFTGDLLFSPAFPSFDQFDDYNQRGNYFKELVSI